MAEWEKDKKVQARRRESYRKNQNDHIPIVSLRKSILETRRIYNNLTDHEFAAWYNKHYKAPMATIFQVLEEAKHGKAAKPVQ